MAPSLSQRLIKVAYCELVEGRLAQSILRAMKEVTRRSRSCATAPYRSGTRFLCCPVEIWSISEVTLIMTAADSGKLINVSKSRQKEHR